MTFDETVKKLPIDVWNRGMTLAAIIFVIGSVLIMRWQFQEILKKELLSSWLVVFSNAYIGAFIASQALKRGPTAFFVWSMLINGMRIGLLVILLLILSQSNVLNFRAFISVTLFGYVLFLVGEVASIHSQSMKAYKS